MAISFNLITANNRVPDVQIEFDPSGSATPPTIPHKAILIGQRTPSGTAAEGVVKGVTSDSKATEFFGETSQLAAMVRAFRALAPSIALYAVALDDDGAGVAAAGNVAFGGVATAPGLMEVWIQQVKLRASVLIGDTANDVAAALELDALDYPELQVSVTATAGVLDFVAENAGEFGNEIDLRMLYQDTEAVPVGLTAVVTPMTGGLANPDVQIALTGMGGSEKYDTIVMPYHDAANLTVMETELEARWGPSRQNDGICFIGTALDLSTTQTLGDSRNSQMLCMMGFGPILMTPWEGAARVAGIDAAMVSPARPRQRRQITGMLPPASGAEFNTTEKELLLHDGISTVRPAAGGRMQIERLITMNQVNSAGFPTTAYLNVTKVRTLSRMRTDLRALISSKYPDFNLAPDGTNVAPGAAVVTPTTIKADIGGLYEFWASQGLVVDIDGFKANMLVEINATDDDRIDVLIYPKVIGALRFMAGKMVFG